MQSNPVGEGLQKHIGPTKHLPGLELLALGLVSGPVGCLALDAAVECRLVRGGPVSLSIRYTSTLCVPSSKCKDQMPRQTPFFGRMIRRWSRIGCGNGDQSCKLSQHTAVNQEQNNRASLSSDQV